jgi:hypothetical protein
MHITEQRVVDYPSHNWQYPRGKRRVASAPEVLIVLYAEIASEDRQ